MNIGLIVHSDTGNTLSVAERLQQKLAALGHATALERVEPVDRSRVKDVKLKAVPDPLKHDALVFGAPVHAFSLSPAMRAYLDQVPSLGDKRVACFVTQFFPFAWMGGTRALRQMTRACQAKGATVCGVGIVNWSRRSRERRISQLVDDLARCLG